VAAPRHRGAPAIAALAGWLAVRWTGDLSHVFVAQSLGLIASGFINVAAVAGGAWFGSLTWPWSTAATLQRRSSI
jgi:MATE family, multidrug efflux pump